MNRTRSKSERCDKKLRVSRKIGWVKQRKKQTGRVWRKAKTK